MACNPPTYKSPPPFGRPTEPNFMSPEGFRGFRRGWCYFFSFLFRVFAKDMFFTLQQSVPEVALSTLKFICSQCGQKSATLWQKVLHHAHRNKKHPCTTTTAEDKKLPPWDRRRTPKLRVQFAPTPFFCRQQVLPLTLISLIPEEPIPDLVEFCQGQGGAWRLVSATVGRRGQGRGRPPGREHSITLVHIAAEKFKDSPAISRCRGKGVALHTGKQLSPFF